MKYITYIHTISDECEKINNKIILYHGPDKSIAKGIVREARNMQYLLEGQVIYVEYNGQIIYQYPNPK